jgi:ribosomal protein L11
MKDVEDIAQIKLPVMNTENIESIKKSIIGTAKNMGIKVA